MSTRPLAALLFAFALTACRAPAPVVLVPEPPSALPPRATPEPGGPMANGYDAMRQRRFEDAIHWFTLARDLPGARGEALTNRAIAQLATARHEAALDDAQAGVDAFGDAETAEALRARFNLAQIQVRLGLYSAAIPTLDALRAYASYRDHATRLLAVAFAETGRADEAEDLLETVSHPHDAATLNDRGVTAELAGHPRLALRLYRDAVGRDREQIEAWRNMGNLQLRLGQHDDAAQSLETYLLLAPVRTGDRGLIQGRLDTLRR